MQDAYFVGFDLRKLAENFVGDEIGALASGR